MTQMDVEDVLTHFGVLGMHWGVRHTRAELEEKATQHEKTAAMHVREAGRAKAEDEDLLKNGLQSAAFKRVYGNEAYKQSEWQFFGKNGQSRAQALQETHNNLRILHNRHVRAANHHVRVATKLRTQAEKLEQSDISPNSSDELLHFGVKGMKWGVRHARSDAHEYVKAKLAYGEGAGTRRKLIKAKVEARAHNNPEYKKAFDKHVEEYSQHAGRLAAQAKVNKRTKSAVKTTAKTARGVHRSLTGGFGSVSLASAGIAGAYLYARRTGLDEKIIRAAQSEVVRHRTRSATEAFLRNNGVHI
jgi:hypothetical protein